MRKKIIAANWKMNMTLTETKSFFDVFKTYLETNFKNIKIDCDLSFFSNPTLFPFLLSIKNELQTYVAGEVKIGSQNLFYENKGAYTGELSIEMLKDIGIFDSIIGHSERREIFLEDDEMIGKKVDACIKNNFVPLLCVGENLEIRQSGGEKEYVKNQIEKNIRVDIKDPNDIVIAYEPIWAIGTGKTASENDAEEMCEYIRSELESKFGKELSEDVRILYGGSVGPETIKNLFSMPNIDGALIGTASLDPEKMGTMMNEIRN